MIYFLIQFKHPILLTLSFLFPFFLAADCIIRKFQEMQRNIYPENKKSVKCVAYVSFNNHTIFTYDVVIKAYVLKILCKLIQTYRRLQLRSKALYLFLWLNVRIIDYNGPTLLRISTHRLSLTIKSCNYPKTRCLL